MPLRLLLLFALAPVILMANEQKQVLNCCEPESEKLSQSKVKALVKQTEPIHAPCCADMLHVSGTVALAISVDPKGNVACVQAVRGHPHIIGVAMDSVRQWKFEPPNRNSTSSSQPAVGPPSCCTTPRFISTFSRTVFREGETSCSGRPRRGIRR
jgi:hypothetical protein